MQEKVCGDILIEQVSASFLWCWIYQHSVYSFYCAHDFLENIGISLDFLETINISPGYQNIHVASTFESMASCGINRCVFVCVCNTMFTQSKL